MNDQTPDEEFLFQDKSNTSDVPAASNPDIMPQGAAQGAGVPANAAVLSAALTVEEERTWAMLAHWSILINLITGFGGPVVALVIYLVYKDRSRYVAYQAVQAFLFQIIVWVGAGIVIAATWILITVLMFVLVVFCLVPVGIVLSFIPLVALVYGVIGGVECNRGQDFRYWLIGDWVRGSMATS